MDQILRPPQTEVSEVFEVPQIEVVEAIEVPQIEVCEVFEVCEVLPVHPPTRAGWRGDHVFLLQKRNHLETQVVAAAALRSNRRRQGPALGQTLRCGADGVGGWWR